MIILLFFFQGKRWSSRSRFPTARRVIIMMIIIMINSIISILCVRMCIYIYIYMCI